MFKKYIKFFAIVVTGITLISWGSTGHRRISHDAALSYSQEMVQFNAWTNILTEHASDADYRKSDDPSESPKHYIDIDNYNEFITTGRIPQTFDSVIALYGASDVIDNGILPWATITTYDSLRSCFMRGDWSKAALVASDLGHYVADGFMPLHITRNYNGQLTGNSGIHSRFESSMINTNNSNIIYSGTPVTAIQNVNQYIFDYLYYNHVFVDSILEADNYAKNINSNTGSTAYKQALWNYSKHFTTNLFKNASHALAALIYTAWTEAGSPSMSSGIEPVVAFNAVLEQNYPNPFSNYINVSYSLLRATDILLEVKDKTGITVATLDGGFRLPGRYTIEWQTVNFSNGLYFLTLQAGNEVKVNKLLKTD
jgi:hypothetical protein